MKPFYERGGVVIYHGRWQDLIPASWDLVVTDPPYGTGGWRRLGAGAGSDPSGSLYCEDWDTGDLAWLWAMRESPVLTFWPAGGAQRLLNAATEAGLTKHRCLYMRKRDPKPIVSGRVRWAVEPIWALSAEGFVLSGGDDVFEDSTPRLGRDSDATGHPYQKPLDVMLWLISKTTAETILDPFMGSGTTLLAARTLGRKAVGIEQDERYCEIAAKRLQQDVLPLFGEQPA